MIFEMLDDATVKKWLGIQAREEFIPRAKELRDFASSRYLEEKDPWEGGEAEVVELVPVQLLDGREEVLTVRVAFRRSQLIDVSVSRGDDLVFSLEAPCYTVTKPMVRVGNITDPRALVLGLEAAKRIIQGRIEEFRKLRAQIEEDPQVRELEERIRARVVLEE